MHDDPRAGDMRRRHPLHIQQARERRATAIDLPLLPPSLLCSSFLKPVSSNMHDNIIHTRIQQHTHTSFSAFVTGSSSLLNYNTSSQLHTSTAEMIHTALASLSVLSRAFFLFTSCLFAKIKAQAARTRLSHVTSLACLVPQRVTPPPPSLISHVECKQKKKLHSERKSDLKTESHGSATAA